MRNPYFTITEEQPSLFFLKPRPTHGTTEVTRDIATSRETATRNEAERVRDLATTRDSSTAPPVTGYREGIQTERRLNHFLVANMERFSSEMPAFHLSENTPPDRIESVRRASDRREPPNYESIAGICELPTYQEAVGMSASRNSIAESAKWPWLD